MYRIDGEGNANGQKIGMAIILSLVQIPPDVNSRVLAARKGQFGAES